MGSYLDYITVAASDSPAWARGIADYVCRGDGDGVTLNRAIKRAADDGKNLYLFDGGYIIDGTRRCRGGLTVTEKR